MTSHISLCDIRYDMVYIQMAPYVTSNVWTLANTLANRTVCAWLRLFHSTTNHPNCLILPPILTCQEQERFGMLDHSSFSLASCVLAAKRRKHLRIESFPWFSSTHLIQFNCRHTALCIKMTFQCCVRMLQARFQQCTFVLWPTSWDGFPWFHAIWMGRNIRLFHTDSENQNWEERYRIQNQTVVQEADCMSWMYGCGTTEDHCHGQYQWQRQMTFYKREWARAD